MSTQNETNTLSGYEQFLLSEYENIASAHFNTINTIAAFFKHYLIIVSLPIPMVGLMLSGKFESSGAVSIVKAALPPMSALLSVVGTCVLAYISNLWFDQILYARTVNGLRNYFTRRSRLSFGELHGVRVLPISPNVPRYIWSWYFEWVVLAFALINTMYFSFSSYLWLQWRSLYQEWPFYGWARQSCLLLRPQLPTWVDIEMLAIVAAIGFFLMNLAVYRFLVRFRERRYLSSRLIGVDIDGVLNRHREHFAAVLLETTNKTLDPEKIERIPVHKCPGLGVTAEDEAIVFNTLKYWKDMPPAHDITRALRRLKKLFPSHQVRLFTGRDWPNIAVLPPVRQKDSRKQWKRISMRLRSPRAITKLTKQWLKQHGIPYDSLVVEHGPEPSSTRYTQAEQGLIRVFVEDDLENAKRLALSCEKVLLLDQPYNQAAPASLPPNLVRVQSWDEALQELPSPIGRELAT